MAVKKNKDEDKAYNKKIEEFNFNIQKLEILISEIETNFDNKIEEFTSFISIMNNSDKFYKKANYAQKQNLSKLLFLSIVLNSQNQVLTNVRHGLEGIFNDNIGQSKVLWEIFEQIYNYTNLLNYQGKKDFYDFYINFYGGNPNLSREEKILYEID